MLTQTLRGLEADGIVARHDHHSANPRVDYSLTAAVIDLLATVHELCGWSRTHLESLLAAHPTVDPRCPIDGHSTAQAGMYSAATSRIQVTPKRSLSIPKAGAH